QMNQFIVESVASQDTTTSGSPNDGVNSIAIQVVSSTQSEGNSGYEEMQVKDNEAKFAENEGGPNQFEEIYSDASAAFHDIVKFANWDDVYSVLFFCFFHLFSLFPFLG